MAERAEGLLPTCAVRGGLCAPLEKLSGGSPTCFLDRGEDRGENSYRPMAAGDEAGAGVVDGRHSPGSASTTIAQTAKFCFLFLSWCSFLRRDVLAVARPVV